MRQQGRAGGLAIGELAARTGVTAQTIRYYERAGVIPAAVRDGSGQYRRYTDADTTRLHFIRRARDLGFSLDEVRGLLALAEGSPDHSCAEVNRIATAHLAQVEDKLAQLARLRDELERVLASCGGAELPVAECGILAALSDKGDGGKGDGGGREVGRSGGRADPGG